jgi:hypothetical protein
MSCQRCGGVLEAELAAAMCDLVCGRAVIESQYCHCGDVASSVQADLSREGRLARAEKPPEITVLEGGTL